MKLRTSASAAGMGMLVALLTSPSPAAAQNGVVHACVDSVNGSVRVVSAASSCRPNELRLSWNLEGQQGPTGPKGDPGDKGDQGDPGPQNVVAIGVHGANQSKTANIPNFGPVTVSCRDGFPGLSLGRTDELFQYRLDITDYNSDQTTTKSFFPPSTSIGLGAGSGGTPGRTIVLYVDNTLGVWKIEATLLHETAPETCYGLAIITIAD